MKSGNVAIVGRSNAGKSTLLNALCAAKVAITSHKKQTTRQAIRGIYHYQEIEIVFVDTPGIHKPKNLLGNYLNRSAYQSILDVDLIYYVVDGSDMISQGDRFLLPRIVTYQRPIFLIINKVDMLKKSQVVEQILQWQQLHQFAEIFPLSALKSDNFEDLITTTSQYLPEGRWRFPPTMITDQSFSFLLGEFVREKVLTYVHQEVPHGVACIVEDLREHRGLLSLSVVIVVERRSQKGILIGKQGSKLKQIASSLRHDLEEYYQKKVFLELYVKVEDDWRRKPQKIQDLGFTHE